MKHPETAATKTVTLVPADATAGDAALVTLARAATVRL